jgi:hypothetical protein
VGIGPRLKLEIDAVSVIIVVGIVDDVDVIVNGKI